jgi:signal peptidase I
MIRLNPFLTRYLLLLPLLALGVLRRLLLVVTVEGLSMTPTLRHGDRVLVLRHWPRYWLRKGHIVLIRGAQTPDAIAPLTCIKRLTGLPGDTVANRYEGEPPQSHDVPRSWTIQPGYCFVAGDAGRASIDSYVWGPIPIEQVLGVVIRRLPRRSAADRAFARL